MLCSYCKIWAANPITGYCSEVCQATADIFSSRVIRWMNNKGIFDLENVADSGAWNTLPELEGWAKEKVRA